LEVSVSVVTTSPHHRYFLKQHNTPSVHTVGELQFTDIDSHRQPLPSNQFPRPWLHLHSGGDGKTDRDSEIEEHPATRYLHRRKRLHTPLAIPPTQNHNSMCLYPVVSATWWSFRREMCRLQDFGRGNDRVKHKYTAHCLASRVPTLSSLPPRFSPQSRKYYTLPTA